MGEHTSAAVSEALRAQAILIMERMGEWFEDDDDDSSYVDAAYQVMSTVLPGLTVAEFKSYVGFAPCDQAGSCCGWCHDCQEHHGDRADDKCNHGYCHDCEHYCENCA